MTVKPVRVTIWNEYRHERQDPAVRAHYPAGIHAVLAAALEAAGCAVRVATLDEPEHGLDAATLAATDVLVWWGHLAHEAVADTVVDRVQQRVLDGMGLVVLHSAHESKIFRRLMGTTCKVMWRERGERERVWVVQPAHPVAAGLPEYFELPQSEMYGEPTDIPAPDELVFISWFQGGEVFRSGGAYTRGRGRIFYFSPGHETFPIYHHPLVQRVIVNAVRWAAPNDFSGAPVAGIRQGGAHRPDPLEPLD